MLFPASRALTVCLSSPRAWTLLGSQRDLHWCGRRFAAWPEVVAGAPDRHRQPAQPALCLDNSARPTSTTSPQGLRCRGGLWVAILSPKLSIVRQASIKRSGRRTSLGAAVPRGHGTEQLRKGQTLNTPAVATLIMMENQIRWLNNGGLARTGHHVAPSPHPSCTRGRALEYAAPFVVDADAR